ncbi:type VI secretion system Vgr family protein [Pseudomonas viridiflava]|uniref:type VI secretion system Vgr family protein n=1 Tax=Pseudomonas viridiflava TaxID=33069 RepID=UPI0013C2D434|nr:contractile injection system protein, VgrG/Pvc8 family [Pseudomonas viridiflava]
MSEGQQMPITLAIVDHKVNLPVISISGWEALNAPYRFVVDCLCDDPHLDFKALEQQAACLALSPDRVVHGKISSATCLHAGTALGLYRIELGPALLDLQQHRQHRVFRNLSAPQIIARLMSEHGLKPGSYRFEQLVGIYPPREACVQHDETDLHLLLRLCEEEGIHFRFEQQQSSHLLIFADDPARFPHRPFPVKFQPSILSEKRSPSLAHLAEQWSLMPTTAHHEAQSHDGAITVPQPANHNELEASNQRFEASILSRLPTERQAHDRQISARTLERQRCERRVILGLSIDLPLTPGQIVQVQAHPEARFNDQWLITEVNHVGKQPEVLQGFPEQDTAQIIDILKSLPTPPGAGSTHCEIEPFSSGYASSLRVLPWEMPFRPGLKHRKAAANGFKPATLLSHCEQEQDQRLNGRLPICFKPLPDACATRDELSAPAALSLEQLKALRIGTALLIAHFDNDPDRPIIHSVPDEHLTQLKDQQALNRMDGLPTAQTVHLDRPQTLHLVTCRDISLTTAESKFELTGTRISMAGAPPQLTAQRHNAALDAPVQHAALSFFDADLRLTQYPGLKGAPLPDRLWYIVRMRQAGLEFLARLQPEHFLFEGKTDKQGYCGLGARQLRELAMAYRNTPDGLCLIHPGHCIKLRDWFEQNWPKRLHQAFIQHG